MVVKVCDAIMGSGKSQAAIRYMNEHTDRKFVYVTPYLVECQRIKDACPDLGFVEPESLKKYRRSKIEHTAVLLQRGENVTTTHTAFKAYTGGMLEAIREHKYTLIIDEALEVFQEARLNRGDLELLTRAGCLSEEDGKLRWVDGAYQGMRMWDIGRMLQSNNLIQVQEGGQSLQYYFWAISHDVLMAFDEVIVLTYLFRSQDFRYYLDLHKIPYRYIGIHRDEGEGPNVFRFVDRPDYVPEYVGHIRDVLHVCEDKSMNLYGSRDKALSIGWLRCHRREQDIMRKHMNTFCRVWCKAKSTDIMWSCYKSQQQYFDMPGFKSNMVPFNMKASNEFRSRFALAYMLNIYPRPDLVKYLDQFGVEYDAEGYALSNMIQWIWRSAIRDGREVWLYLPSQRMRKILNDWMDRLEAGDVFPSDYCAAAEVPRDGIFIPKGLTLRTNDVSGIPSDGVTSLAAAAM